MMQKEVEKTKTEKIYEYNNTSKLNFSRALKEINRSSPRQSPLASVELDKFSRCEKPRSYALLESLFRPAWLMP
jgi:hypothetical protein